jgi:hypothetical protein
MPVNGLRAAARRVKHPPLRFDKGVTFDRYA